MDNPRKTFDETIRRGQNRSINAQHVTGDDGYGGGGGGGDDDDDTSKFTRISPDWKTFSN
jgi:hypothetical protein